MAFVDNETVITAAWLNNIDNITTAYTSPEQTITTAGQLVLAHGLASAPQIIQVQLVCKTAEANYSVGDVVHIHAGFQSGNSGVSVVSDATNITLRFGSNTTVFVLLDKTTGAGVGVTNNNWRLIVKAWTMQ